MTITDVRYKLYNALDAYISALKAIPFYDESELSAIQDNQQVAECLENAKKANDYAGWQSYEALAMVYLSRREGIIELYKATKAVAEELAAKTLIARLEDVANGASEANSASDAKSSVMSFAKQALEHARPWQGLAKDESRIRKVIGPVRQAGTELRREDCALNVFMWALKFDEARVSNPSDEHDGILKDYVKQLDEIHSHQISLNKNRFIIRGTCNYPEPPTTGPIAEILKNAGPNRMAELRGAWPGDETLEELLKQLKELDD